MSILSWLGFLASGFAYIAVFFLVLTLPNKEKVHKGLMLALLGGFTWSSTIFVSRFVDIPDFYIYIAESIRLISLISFVKAMLNVDNQFHNNRFGFVLFSLVSALLVFIPTADAFALTSKNTIFVMYLAVTVCCLILLEILFRQAKSAMWSIKPMLLSLGALLIFDFITFANASLVQQVDPDMWLARGYLHAIFVPLLLVSIKRTKALNMQIFISRDMVFQSSLLFATGAYLLLMAAAGYYINSIEAQWSHLAQILFLVLAFAFLILLFISDSSKRRFKVFIEKNFFANRFDYRARWLSLTQLVSSSLDPDETVYQRALTGFMSSVDYDQGAIAKLNNGTLNFKAVQGIEFNEQSTQILNSLLVPYCIERDWIIDINEYLNSVQNYPGLVVPYNTASSLTYQVIIPIYEGSKIWGVAILNHSEEPLKFNWELRDYMKVVSMQLGSYILQFEANKQLTENAQFAAFNRTSAFVVHDLKNVLAQIRLILTNGQKHKHNPEFIDDTFETLAHTDARMQKMLDQLMSKQTDESSTEKLSIANIIEQQVLEKTQKSLPQVTFDNKQDFDYTLDADRFASVLSHLIDNAQQATEDSGNVTLQLSRDDQFGIISIADTGCGMTSEFIENKLFAPFITTKGNAGMGIGAYDAKQFVSSLNGRLEVTSVINQGSKFVIYLPLG